MNEPYRPRRILLTGASGTIGSLAGPTFLAAGIPLRLLVHRRRPAWIPSAPAPQGATVEIVRGDLLAPESLRGLADGCDVVVHAAGRTGFGALDRARQRRVNVEGTRALLAEADSAGARRFLLAGYAGTIQERGGDAAVEETTPPAARYESEYVRMKFESETDVLEANRADSLRTSVVSAGALVDVRGGSLLAGLAGLHLRRELPFRLLENVWLAVTAARDVGPAFLAAAARAEGGRRYFALGESLRLGEFFRRLEARSGVPAPRRRLPDLLVEELGAIAPLLPPASFLRRLVLPRELVLHLRRLAPARSDRTRAELGWTPCPLDEVLEELIRAAGPSAADGSAGPAA
jgi:dihydroflavonol-4-reductase